MTTKPLDTQVNRMIIENTNEITGDIDRADLGSLKDDILSLIQQTNIELLEKIIALDGNPTYAIKWAKEQLKAKENKQ